MGWRGGVGGVVSEDTTSGGDLHDTYYIVYNAHYSNTVVNDRAICFHRHTVILYYHRHLPWPVTIHASMRIHKGDSEKLLLFLYYTNFVLFAHSRDGVFYNAMFLCLHLFYILK